VLEDLAALLRLPTLFPRITKVLNHARAIFQLPNDAPFLLVDPNPGTGTHDWGYRWMDKNNLLMVFMGLSWGHQNCDPLWEVHVQCCDPKIAEMMRAGDWQVHAARRAETRFSEWDKFWHEDLAGTGVLLGTSAAATRFFEEESSEQMAAEYLGGAFYALHASGALQALLEVARQFADPGLGSTTL